VSFAPASTAPKEEVNTAGIMVWSIVTLFCCNVGGLLGFFAVIFSLIAGVEKDYDSAKAKRYLQIAKICNIVALIVGVIGMILYLTVFAQFAKVFQEIMEQAGAGNL
jgi:uncharacterized membrane protein